MPKFVRIVSVAEPSLVKAQSAYHAWRGEPQAGAYADVPGFCNATKLKDVRAHNYLLTPGRYVGAAEVEEDDVPFKDKMKQLTEALFQQMHEARRLDASIAANLKGLGYGGRA